MCWGVSTLWGSPQSMGSPHSLGSPRICGGLSNPWVPLQSGGVPLVFGGPPNAWVTPQSPQPPVFWTPQNYDTTESKLRREFEVYGPIKRVSAGGGPPNPTPPTRPPQPRRLFWGAACSYRRVPPVRLDLHGVQQALGEAARLRVHRVRARAGHAL